MQFDCLIVCQGCRSCHVAWQCAWNIANDIIYDIQSILQITLYVSDPKSFIIFFSRWWRPSGSSAATSWVAPWPGTGSASSPASSSSSSPLVCTTSLRVRPGSSTTMRRTSPSSPWSWSGQNHVKIPYILRGEEYDATAEIEQVKAVLARHRNKVASLKYSDRHRGVKWLIFHTVVLSRWLQWTT